jgi:hypothetical protein
MTRVFDLFGDPVAANFGGRGRPEHLPTQQNRNRVSMLVGLGWSNERIAGAMLISLPTLRKHYFSELKLRGVARDRLDARLAMKLWQQVEGGNVGAMREFQKLLDRNDLMQYGQTRPPLADEAPAEKLGKKDAAVMAARAPDLGSRMGELMARRQSPLDS